MDATLQTYACTTCHKTFSGPVPLRQHLESIQHQKKTKLDSFLKIPESTEYASHHPLSYCQICHKKFSGPVPYTQHLLSRQHAKQTEKQEIIKEVDQRFVKLHAYSAEEAPGMDTRQEMMSDNVLKIEESLKEVLKHSLKTNNQRNNMLKETTMVEDSKERQFLLLAPNEAAVSCFLRNEYLNSYTEMEVRTGQHSGSPQVNTNEPNNEIKNASGRIDSLKLWNKENVYNQVEKRKTSFQDSMKLTPNFEPSAFAYPQAKAGASNRTFQINAPYHRELFHPYSNPDAFNQQQTRWVGQKRRENGTSLHFRNDIHIKEKGLYPKYELASSSYQQIQNFHRQTKSTTVYHPGSSCNAYQKERQVKVEYQNIVTTPFVDQDSVRGFSKGQQRRNYTYKHQVQRNHPTEFNGMIRQHRHASFPDVRMNQDRDGRFWSQTSSVLGLSGLGVSLCQSGVHADPPDVGNQQRSPWDHFLRTEAASDPGCFPSHPPSTLKPACNPLSFPQHCFNIKGPTIAAKEEDSLIGNSLPFPNFKSFSEGNNFHFRNQEPVRKKPSFKDLVVGPRTSKPAEINNAVEAGSQRSIARDLEAKSLQKAAGQDQDKNRPKEQRSVMTRLFGNASTARQDDGPTSSVQQDPSVDRGERSEISIVDSFPSRQSEQPSAAIKTPETPGETAFSCPPPRDQQGEMKKVEVEVIKSLEMLSLKNVAKAMDSGGEFLPTESASYPFLEHIRSNGLRVLKADVEGNRCSVCTRDFSGPIPFYQHVIGRQHAKQLRKRELLQSCCSDRLQLPDSEHSFTENLSQGEKHPERRSPHESMASTADHGSETRQVRSEERPDSNRSKPEKGSGDNPGETAEAASRRDFSCIECSICSKKFSGPIPFSEHLGSKVHAKNLKKRQQGPDQDVCKRTGFPSGEDLGSPRQVLERITQHIEKEVAKIVEGGRPKMAAPQDIAKSAGDDLDWRRGCRECKSVSDFRTLGEFESHFRSFAHARNSFFVHLATALQVPDIRDVPDLDLLRILKGIEHV